MKAQAKIYKSDVFEAVHSSMQDLYEIGAIDKKTMRQFDQTCLVGVEDLKPEQIRTLREQNSMSQAVFARHLNMSPSTIRQWESGAKHPSGSALKLLSVVKRHGVQVLTA